MAMEEGAMRPSIDARAASPYGDESEPELGRGKNHHSLKMRVLFHDLGPALANRFRNGRPRSLAGSIDIDL